MDRWARRAGKLVVVVYGVGFVAWPVLAAYTGFRTYDHTSHSHDSLVVTWIMVDVIWGLSPVTLVVPVLIGAGVYGLYALYRALDPPAPEDRVAMLEKKNHELAQEIEELKRADLSQFEM